MVHMSPSLTLVALDMSTLVQLQSVQWTLQTQPPTPALPVLLQLPLRMILLCPAWRAVTQWISQWRVRIIRFCRYSFDACVLLLPDLMPPTVNETDLISTAGQPLSVECMFQMTDNLIRPPTVQWVNSSGSVQSDTTTLSFFSLLTSHGGEYTCTVTINIPELNILLTGEGTTTITVQSKRFNYHNYSLVHTLFCSSTSIYCH